MNWEPLGTVNESVWRRIIPWTLSALSLLIAVSVAEAQFQCPTPTPGLAGASSGLDLPVTTVEIAVTGENAPPGGKSNMTASVTGGDGNIATLFFDVCFDPDVFAIDQAPNPAGPCRVNPPLCPGNQPCESGQCIEQIATSCNLLGDLSQTHTLKASFPEIPENPDDPVRIRLAVITTIPSVQQCSVDEDCPSGQICPFGTTCATLCEEDVDCAPNRCKDVLVGTAGEEVEESICTPLDLIAEGDIVQCEFDVLPDAPFGSTSLDFTDLIDASDDNIPVPNPLPVVGIGDVVDVFMCTSNEQCPGPDEDCEPGKECVDGRCVCPPPTPTPTITATPVNTATPTVTDTPGTQVPTHTPTDTPITEGPTATPTPTGPTSTPTQTRTGTETGPTSTPTSTGGTVTRTPTRTATSGTPAAVGDDDDSCQIVPGTRDAGLRGWMLLLVPGLIAWRRSKRRWS